MHRTPPPWPRRLFSILAAAFSKEQSVEPRGGGRNTGAGDFPQILFALFIAVLTLWPFNFFQKNSVQADPRGGVSLKSPSIAYIERAGQRFSSLQEFTLLVRYQSDEVQPVNYNTILALERERTTRRFLLRRQRGRAIFSMIGLPYPLMAEPVDDVGKAVWAVVRSNRRECRLTVDGVEASTRILEESPIPYEPEAPLIFGSEADGHFTWSGTLFVCAVLSRCVSDEELQDPEKLLSDSSLVLAIRTHNAGESREDPRTAKALVDLRVPDRFVPYTRTMFLHMTLYFTSTKPYVSDIALNIILFVPFGCFVAASAGRRDVGLVGSVLWAGAAAIILSTAMEFAQAYLPGRFSSTADVMSNTLGGLLGGFLCAQGTIVRPIVTWLRPFLPPRNGSNPKGP